MSFRKIFSYDTLMKSVFSLSVSMLILLLSCQSSPVAPLQSEIDSIAKHWVSDRRTGICNLALIDGSGAGLVLKGETMFPGARTKVLELLSSKGFSVIDSVIILPDTTHLEKNWGLVTLSVANIRTKPAHSSELVSQAIMGTPVRILKDHEGWVMIQTPDQYIGWTNKSAVQQMSRSEISDWRKADRLVFAASEGKIYGDCQKISVVSDLVAGAIVVKKSEDRDCTVVALPDGRTGYVSNQNWLCFDRWKDTVSLKADQLIVSGKQLMGFPYLWGGTSSKGMDCSGFVKTIFFLNGYILERDASQQIHHGMVVDIASGWGKLQRGDLLFFGSKESFRVNHVGLYIGDSQLIHESGSVHINSLEKSRPDYNEELDNNLVGARRIIGYSPEQGFWPIKNHSWY